MPTSRPHASRSDRAFTLVELLVVLSIFAAIGYAASRYWMARPDRRVRVAAQELLVAFRQARAYAIHLHRPVYVDFAPGAHTPADGLYTAFADLDGDGQPDPGEHEAARLVGDEVVDGIPVRRLPRGVRFGGSGLTRGPRGTVLFGDGISFSGGLDRAILYGRGTASAGTCYLTGRDDVLSVYAVRTTIPGFFEVWSNSGDGWQREW